MITKDSLKSIPPSIGVYIFKQKKIPLYIGKAVNLKTRLISHLENAKLDAKEQAIISNSDSIEYLLTDSEFKALLLEAKLIQKFHPKYNSRWRDDKSYLYIKLTKNEEYPKLFSIRYSDITEKKSLYFGPFPSSRDVNEILGEIRKIFPFCTQKKLTNRSCFYSKIGLCNPCPNYIHQIKEEKLKTKLKKQYRQNIKKIINVLEGNTELTLKSLYRKMKKAGADQNYEEALSLRKRVTRFERLIEQKQFSQDIISNYNLSEKSVTELLKLLSKFYPRLNKLERIECYDVSNLSFKDATASMIVFTNGLPDKNQYKRFKIKDLNLISDFEMLEEIFRRRFKNDWQKPDLIVVDGGTPQVLKLNQIMHSIKKSIPFIGIAKHPDRVVISRPYVRSVKPEINNLGFNLVRALRDEAHRFAKKYHLLLRGNKML